MRGKSIRFVTLTLKHNDTTLTEQLDKLIRCFRHLRQLPVWKDNIDGAAGFIEVTHNERTKQWHPHIHILTTGLYLPQQRLRSAWLQVTGDSHIVDVQFVRSAATAANYVTKYIAKPIGQTLLNNQQALQEAMVALRGRHLISAYNAWRGEKLLHHEADRDWEPIMTWELLVVRFKQGDPEAKEIYYALQHLTGVADEVAIDERSEQTHGPPA